MFGSHVHRRRVGKRDVQMEQALRDAHVRRGLELGVRAFDVYEHNYKQWGAMARLLKPVRKDVVISLTLGGDDPEVEIDRALGTFGTDYIDLYRIYKSKGKALRPAEEKRYEALAKAKKAGKVRAIGSAQHGLDECFAVLEAFDDLDCLFVPFNFRQNALTTWKDLLPRMLEREMGLVVIKPFGKGAMFSPAAVKAVAPRGLVGAEATRADIATASLKWILAHPFVTSVCASMYSKEEVEVDAAAARSAGAGGKAAVGERRLIEAVRTAMAETGPAVYPRGYGWLEGWTA
jgi:aryl-alcohol dehydrogenase-like predicted oxidoreductase